MHLVLDI